MNNFVDNYNRNMKFLPTGFTLIETLVAISILLMAVVAPMTFITKDISAILATDDKIIALYLAEDAIDFVKYKIMTNFNNTTPTPWLNGVIDLAACSYGQPCRVDSFYDTLVDCGGVCLPINYNPSSGVYTHTSGGAWIPSKFTRTVTMRTIPVADDPDPLQAPQEMIIVVQVIWDYKGTQKTTEISEHVFSWGS